MLVSKNDAVAICQDYGYSTADGWTEAKLTKKVHELSQLFRSGEFEPDDDLVPLVKRIAEAISDGEDVEVGDGTVVESEDAMREENEEEEGGDEDEAMDASRCPLAVGDRVVVKAAEGSDWKGIVDEVIRADYVMVRDRNKATWEVYVSQCRLAKRAASSTKRSSGSSSGKTDEDAEDAEIRDLQERLRALKAKRKVSKNTAKKPKQKKLKREELALKILRSHPGGDGLEELGEELDSRWVQQGRKSNVKASASAMRRVVKAGVLFGLLQMDGQQVMWNREPESK